MLEESTRCRDEDVHARKPLSLILQVLPANHEASREAMESANATQDVEDLDGLWDIGKRPTTNGRACSALTSSLVGDMINAPKPSCGPHFRRYKISSTGMRNARVFPLPVRAAPRTSLPLREVGMLLDWISVMSTKCARLRPSRTSVRRKNGDGKRESRTSLGLVRYRKVCKGLQVGRWLLHRGRLC